MYRTDRYFIGVQLIRTIDVPKHLTVYNYENKIHAEISDDEVSQIKTKKIFTIGDLKNLLKIVGFDDLVLTLEKTNNNE